NKRLKTSIFFLMALFVFTACQEEIVKDDYEVLDPSKAPSVTTGEPVQVSSNFAVLSGTSQGEDIEKGVLLADNEELNSASVFTVTPEDEFQVRASGLVSSTQYYYAAFSVNADGGLAVGEVKSFTTLEGVVEFDISYETASVEDWENANFETIDMDGDGEDWGLTYYNEDAGQAAFASYSWFDSPLTPENYLVFPEMQFEGKFGVLTFTIQAGDPDWFAEKVKLVVSAEPITAENARDAEVIFTHTLENAEMYTASVDVPAAYEGSPVYFALVHADVTDNFVVYFLGADFSYAK
ncbi:MAG: choice-of-anchor J domain-containing protein, partial [Mariniphaga sp.]